MAFQPSAYARAFQVPIPPPPPPPGATKWSSLGAGPTVDVVIESGQTVVLDVPAIFRSLKIKSGGALGPESGGPALLESRAGNIVVEGLLDLGSRADVHWVGIYEPGFVGGHTMVPLASDPGFWVMGDGDVRCTGAVKPWTEAAGSFTSGQSRVEVRDVAGFAIGDEVMIAPMLPVSEPNFWNAYDRRTVVDITGSELILNAPLDYDHPALGVPFRNLVFTAEVVNLSRSVVFRGEPGGRAHILIMGNRAQQLSWFAMNHMGPRKLGADPLRPTLVAPIMGRYPYHVHMMQDRSRGSLVIGALIRNSGNSGFVLHFSHGITLQQCVADDVLGELWGAFGGDHVKDVDEPAYDLLFDCCVGSRVRYAAEVANYQQLTAFDLIPLSGHRMLKCRAFGVDGTKNSSGALWPESGGVRGSGTWTVADFVGHNNRGDGWFSWQNSHFAGHDLGPRNVLFNNGEQGFDFGAYSNTYQVTDLVSVGNGKIPMTWHTQVKRDDLPTRVTGGYLDASGRPYAVENPQPHGHWRQIAAVMRSVTFAGYAQAAVAFTGVATSFDPNKVEAYRKDFIDCVYLGPGQDFYVGDLIHPLSVIRVQDALHGSIALYRKDDPRGTLKPEWNCKVAAIPPFG